MTSRRERRLALLKVLAAAAWADGRIDPQEVAHIRKRMESFDLDALERTGVDSLLESPVSYARCEELTRELLGMLDTPAERDEVLDEVKALLEADGTFDDEERELLSGLRGVMDSMDAADTFMDRVTGVFRKMFANRPGVASAPSYIKNDTLQKLHQISGGAWTREIEGETLNRHTLFGAVLGRVAQVDNGIDDAELERIRKLLLSKFHLRDPLLSWVTQAVRQSASLDAGRQELLSEFNRIASMEERIQLLDACFSVAEADGTISAGELEELRLIANFLWIEPRTFHRLRVNYQGKA